MERAWHCRKCPGVFCNTLIWLRFRPWWHFWVSLFCRSQGCGAQVSSAYTMCAVQCQGVLAPQIEEGPHWDSMTEAVLSNVIFSRVYHWYQMRSWWLLTVILWRRKFIFKMNSYLLQSKAREIDDRVWAVLLNTFSGRLKHITQNQIS